MTMKKQSELLRRVREMESRFDGLTGKVEGLDAALSALEASKPDLEALRDYLESGQWQADYESDEAGRIPAGVKRGVLSQDGLYDLLQRVDELVSRVQELLS